MPFPAPCNDVNIITYNDCGPLTIPSTHHSPFCVPLRVRVCPIHRAMHDHSLPLILLLIKLRPTNVSKVAYISHSHVSTLSVILSFRLGATPPRAPCEPQVCVFPLCAVFFLALLMLTYFYFCLLPFVRFRFGHRLFHPVFFLRVLCCLPDFGFCSDSFSV